MNLREINQHVDLLALTSQHTTLKKVASSGGGEWAGPCPFCAGTDRFRVQPYAPGGGRWLCRRCTGGRWQDAIAFGQRLWPAVPFLEVCERLAGLQDNGQEPAGKRPPAKRSQRRRRLGYSDSAAGAVGEAEQPAYAPPQERWQADARLAVEVCTRNLWESQGEAAREYLIKRHLKAETLRYWQLGYSPGAKFGELWVPRGVLIPCVVHAEIWYLKIALLPGDRVKCQGCRQQVPARRPCPHCGTINKYRGVKGNRPAAIYGADELLGAWGALFVEGEFDALVAWQELQDVIAVCTLGSATNRPDLATWGSYLLPLQVILAAYDADPAGQQGLTALQELADKVLPLDLPGKVKDLNDYVTAGGELWPWLKAALLELGLVEEEGYPF